MTRKNELVAGISFGLFFILCGVTWLISNLIPEIQINWSIIWPVFILFPGVFFWALYLFNRNDYALLIPANVLVFLSITFFINILFQNAFNYPEIWALLAFMYPGSVAMSFWIVWFISKKNILLVPAVILSMASLLVMCISTFLLFVSGPAGDEAHKVFWPLTAICIGLFIIMGPLWTLPFKDGEGRWIGKTEKEWEEWGKKFGKEMEKTGNNLEESIDGLASDLKDAEEAEVVK